MEIKRIGVLGAGVMGCDLALDFVIHNYQVILYDTSIPQFISAKERITTQYRFYKMMNPQSLNTADEIMEEIIFTNDEEALSGAGIIIESVTENWDVKKKLFLMLNNIAGEKTIIASNTSCIPIGKLASLMNNREKIIGSHFMNPAHLKKFVEVIKGKDTSDETVKTMIEFLKSLDKKTVVVNDSPGFVSNRVLMLTINESIKTVEEGIAKPADVDKIFKLGFSHAMGPLATADLIGLDTIMYSLLVLHDEFKDTKYLPCGLLCDMVEAGTLGKKSGKGFYNY